jgi:hypothetical protein
VYAATGGAALDGVGRSVEHLPRLGRRQPGRATGSTSAPPPLERADVAAWFARLPRPALRPDRGAIRRRSRTRRRCTAPSTCCAITSALLADRGPGGGAGRRRCGSRPTSARFALDGSALPPDGPSARHHRAPRVPPDFGYSRPHRSWRFTRVASAARTWVSTVGAAAVDPRIAPSSSITSAIAARSALGRSARSGDRRRIRQAAPRPRRRGRDRSAGRGSRRRRAPASRSAPRRRDRATPTSAVVRHRARRGSGVRSPGAGSSASTPSSKSSTPTWARRGSDPRRHASARPGRRPASRNSAEHHRRDVEHRCRWRGAAHTGQRRRRGSRCSSSRPPTHRREVGQHRAQGDQGRRS